MICILLATFVLVLTHLISAVIELSVNIKYAVVVFLPRGIVGQAAAPNAQQQASLVYNNILYWLANITVSLVEYAALLIELIPDSY
jgi:hypothetical protein